MSYVTLGLFSQTLLGKAGGVILMLGHGFVSSALFICVGILYSRYHTRAIRYYSGLSQVMPVFSIFFFVFIFANAAFPGSINFVGELLVIQSLIYIDTVTTIIALSAIILTGIYSVWLLNRILFCTPAPNFNSYCELTKREFFALLLLAALTILFGVCPNVILSLVESGLGSSMV